MTHSIASKPHATSVRRLAQGAWLALAVLGLAGCAANKNGYSGAASAQQRMEAEKAENELTAGSGKAPATLDTAATYLKLVEQMQQNGLWFASLAHIDALEQRWGGTPASSRLRADALRQTGQPVESAGFYKRLIGTPLESAGYHGLGLLAGAREEFAEAARLMEQARRTRPADPVLLGDLGYALLRAGQTSEARLRLMQALQLKPDNQQAQLNLAFYFEATHQPAQALAVMDAHNMNEEARAGVRDAARQISGGSAMPAPPAAVSAGPGQASLLVQDPAPAPLALKASGWGSFAGRVATQSVAGGPAASSLEANP